MRRTTIPFGLVAGSLLVVFGCKHVHEGHEHGAAAGAAAKVAPKGLSARAAIEGRSGSKLTGEAVFTEVFRILRPGGLYVGSTFAPSSSLPGMIAARIGGIRRVAPTELSSWLSSVGFADYEELRLGDSFVFRTRKP